jgi:hypothetical protein
MSLKDRQRDYFNTQLLKLVNDAKEFYVENEYCDVCQVINDLKNDIKREFDNSQFVK